MRHLMFCSRNHNCSAIFHRQRDDADISHVLSWLTVRGPDHCTLLEQEQTWSTGGDHAVGARLGRTPVSNR